MDKIDEDYLSKAKEADEIAQKSQNPALRDTWRKIADNYRILVGAREKS